MHAFGKAFARFHFLFADTIDDGETAIDAVTFAKLCKVHDRRKRAFAVLRTANRLVFFRAGSVERHVYKIDFVFQLDRDIPFVDKVALPVGV